MANEVTKKSTNEMMSGASKNFYEKYGEAATRRKFVGRLLKFSKFGEYCAGSEDEEIARGTALAVYMSTLEIGWVRWEDGRPVDDSNMGLIADGYVPPKRHELGYLDRSQWEAYDDEEPRDPWQFTNQLVMVDRENEEFFTFTTSSKGGLGAIGELAKDHGKHIRLHPDEMPIVKLDGGSYKHPKRKYGEIRFPIFKVTDRIPLAKLPALDGGLVSNEASVLTHL
jgi:hypothetical protein